MGVGGLWKILEPAGNVRSLTDLAVKDGFLANPDQKRGFRIGIDASIWFFHAEYGKEGENPELRTIFFRCARLAQTTFLPLFVFDGPMRPDFKRGKQVKKMKNKLIPGVKRIVEAFGFEWRTAPGEAEAELAYLNRIGVIDGVLSDDVDNFLFGATTVIRNKSNTLSGNKANPNLNSKGKNDENHTRVFYLHDIQTDPQIQLTRGGMILIALLSGGDYNPEGVPGCGVKIAHGIARCGFGDSLFTAAQTLSREALEDFLVSWRHELIHELRTNSKGIIGRKEKALSTRVTNDFPDIDILLSYVNPVTSQSMGRESNNLLLTWDKEPALADIAGACELFFEWGYKEAIIKRFRTVIWPGIVLRILRRAVLDQEERERRRRAVPSTPSRKGRKELESGTPSKMIAARFATMTVESPEKAKSYLSDSEDEDEEDRLIVGISTKRTHTSTDGLLEYRVEIRPQQLIELAEKGIKGLRSEDQADEWDEEMEAMAQADGEDGGGKKKKGQPVEPQSLLRLWMPACMVKMAEPKLAREFEEADEEKALKKIKAAERKAAREAGIPLPRASPKAKAPAKSKAKPKKAVVEDKALDVFSAPTPPSPSKPTKITKQSIIALFDEDYRSLAREEEEESEGDELPSLPVFSAKPTAPKPPPKTAAAIKDLRKKKHTTDTSTDLRTFFTTSTSTAQTSTTTATSTNSTYMRTTMSSIFSAKPSGSSSSFQKENVSSSSRPAPPSDLDDGTWEEYDLALWDKPTAGSSSKASSSSLTTATASFSANTAVPRSPSKRAARNSSPGWSSDEAFQSQLTKSPRKSLQQSSPRPTQRNGVRETSPSPMRRTTSGTQPSSSLGSTRLRGGATGLGKEKLTTVTKAVKKAQTVQCEVIELSDSDSDDDGLPKRVMPLRDLPPLLAARAKGNVSSVSKPKIPLKKTTTTVPSKVVKPKKAPIIHGDVIELSD